MSKPLPAEMQALDTVAYAEYLLQHGHYAIDVNTGVVTNARTGRQLKPTMGIDDYPYVTLAYSQFVTRPIRIHRLIAVVVWGADAVRGMQVAHLDGNRAHSYMPNLALLTPKAHVLYDGTMNLPRTLPKQSWPNCVRCGTSGGTIDRHCRTPTRITGRRFGIEGSLCRKCYRSLENQQQRAPAGGLSGNLYGRVCHGEVLATLADGVRGRGGDGDGALARAVDSSRG